MYQNGCNAYRQSAANTVEDRRVILIKLYDGALKFLANAKRGIIEQSPRIKSENISKTMAIIDELNCALDMDNGGPLASQLDSLYQFAMDQLTTANLKNDLQALGQAEKILGTLKEGFEGAYKQLKHISGAPQPQPPVIEKTVPVQEGVRFAV